MKLCRSSWWHAACAGAAALWLAGCASGPGRAPVEDRPVAGRPAATAAPAAAAAEAANKPSPSTEAGAKPGFHTVRAGDTLIRIGLDVGQNWRDIARWNNIENTNLIEVGQVLRVVPPGSDAPVAVTRPVAAGARGESRPAAPGATAVSTPASAASAGVAAPPQAAGPRDVEEDLGWIWPAAGPVAVVFDEGRSKGLAITGKAGDPVLAAADGRVVYAGSGLRGYGNLIIVKHNNTYLTAYAHNQALLVKEDQAVRRGQRIAEMGSTDAERVQLHFEIRRQGKPVDPAKLLPQR